MSVAMKSDPIAAHTFMEGVHYARYGYATAVRLSKRLPPPDMAFTGGRTGAVEADSDGQVVNGFTICRPSTLQPSCMSSE